MLHYPPPGRCWGRSGYLNYAKFKCITSYKACCSIKSQPSPHLKDGGLKGDLRVKCSHFCTCIWWAVKFPCTGQVLLSNASPSTLLPGREVVGHNLVIGALLLRSKYSRTLIIRISIQTLSYPKGIFNLKIPKTIWFSAKPSNKWNVCVIFRGLLYHTVQWVEKHISMCDNISRPHNWLSAMCKNIIVYS